MLKKISWQMKIIIIASFLFCAATITWFFAERESQANHHRLNGILAMQATQMTNSMNYALTQAYGLQALVLGHEGKNIKLEELGTILVNKEYAEYVRNILIAPKGVVTQVFPVAGNENVLGLDLYSNKNASAKEALLTQSSDEIVVSGPYNLVQGGQAISGRLAVRLPKPNGSYENWGLVSVTLAFPQVMESTGMNMLEKTGYVYRVFRQDPQTKEYLEVLNHGFEKGNNHEAFLFSFKTMNFKIEAYPLHGWVDKRNLLGVFLASFLGLMLLGLLIGVEWFRQETLREKARKDAMTGLLNREAGIIEINTLLQSRCFTNGVFILIDIDNFKTVNDTLMHKTGDEVLVQASNYFATIFRASDVVCRLGGDEFIVFVNEPSGQEFLKEKLRNIHNLMRRTITVDSKTVQISCSIGVALAPDHGKSFEQLYAHADEALYHSKENGRDCTTLYPDKILSF